jgi:hypothetical protein
MVFVNIDELYTIINIASINSYYYNRTQLLYTRTKLILKVHRCIWWATLNKWTKIITNPTEMLTALEL